MSTPQYLPFVANRRRVILVEGKWRVEVIRSRRRELMLRELCHRYYFAGFSRSLADAVDIGGPFSSCNENEDAVSDGDRMRNGRHQSETLTLLENLERAIKETSGARRDMSLGVALSDLQPYPSNKQFIDGSHPFLSLRHPFYSGNAPVLRLGSKQNAWLDFGGDAYNIAGGTHSLPVIIQAPGRSREDDPNPDLAIYFDVEIESSSPLSLMRKGSFHFWFGEKEIDCSIDETSNDNSITIKEGEFRVVYITWAPTNEGCLREQINVKTRFNGTQEEVAEEEIIIVGCARRENNDVIVQNNKVVNGGSRTHNFDLAQSPLDYQPYGSEHQVYQTDFGDIDDSPESIKGKNEIYHIDEEERQSDLVQTNLRTTQYDFQTQSENSHETTNHFTYHGENGQIQNDSPMEHGEEITTTSTTLPPLHIALERSIAYNQKLAKLRASRATIPLATARDHYGQRILPLRATHPLAVSNHPGLSDRAKLLRFSRYTTRPQLRKQQDLSISRQEDANTLSRQTDDLSSETSPNGVAVQNDDVSTIKEVVSPESTLESSDGYDGVIGLRIKAVGETILAANSSPNPESILEISEGQPGKEGPPGVESREVDNHSGQAVDRCPPNHSDSSSDIYDVAGHETNASSTDVALQTIGNMRVGVDNAHTAASGDLSHHIEKQIENPTSSLVDEISDMHDFLTTVHGPVSNLMVATADVSSDLAVDVTEAQLRTTKEAETANGPKAFTFDESPTSQSARLLSEGSVDTDDESTMSSNAANADESYENVTSDLNDLMRTNDTVESTTTKRKNTPLKDLHDQINFLIGAHHSVSPITTNQEFTPEPDHVVPLTLHTVPLVMSSSESYKSSSSKAKHQPSTLNNPLYKDVQQPEHSNRGSAKRSARKLYFYKSPRNADNKPSKAARTSASNGKIEKDVNKNEVEDNVSSSQDESSSLAALTTTNEQVRDELEVESKDTILGQPLFKPTTKSELRKSYPLQTARTDIESNYKSRLQSIRKNRSSGSLTKAAVDVTQNESPQDRAPPKAHSVVHQQTSARHAARKLYFFKAPSERMNDIRSRKSGNGESEAINVLDVKDEPSTQVPKAKSPVDMKPKLSPPAPALSSRELLAIEKHVQSMKKSNRKSIA